MLQSSERDEKSRLKRAPNRIHLGSEGSEGEEESEHELLVLAGIERAEGSVPLAVEKADAVAVEDVEHVGVVPGVASGRPGRRRRGQADVNHRGTTEKLHRRRSRDLSSICAAEGQRLMRSKIVAQ